MSTQNDRLPGNPISLWLGTTPETNFPSLHDGLEVDVVVIGGGMVGVTAATLLKDQGKKVAVLEAGRIVEGVTANTTAKVTSLHTLIYDYLIQNFGLEKAQGYADANQAAIAKIAKLIQTKEIDCEFTSTAAYTFTESDEEVDKIKAEVDAALKLGLPASFVTETPLPFPVKAAIRFDNQAQFHPRKYLLALAKDIPGEGSHIFENTRVTAYSGGDPCLVTARDETIKAGAVIVASHYPIGDKTFYATRLKPHRSYLLAARLAGPVPQGMFISSDSSHTLRNHQSADSTYLLVGGEGHPTGEGGDTIARYQRIEQWARDRFEVQAIEYRWSTQDNQTLDRVPYIGPYSPTSKHVYVGTGFDGWGMTHSTVAAMILSDLILQRENPWASVYNPNRVDVTSVPKFVKQTLQVAKHFVGDRLPLGETEDLLPGEGKIVYQDKRDLAMYKDEDGTLYVLSPACSHMGCFVQWNPAEKSWDCPCHGSRFAVDGKVLHGPATEDLKQVKP